MNTYMRGANTKHVKQKPLYDIKKTRNAIIFEGRNNIILYEQNICCECFAMFDVNQKMMSHNNFEVAKT